MIKYLTAFVVDPLGLSLLHLLRLHHRLVGEVVLNEPFESRRCQSSVTAGNMRFFTSSKSASAMVVDSTVGEYEVGMLFQADGDLR